MRKGVVRGNPEGKTTKKQSPSTASHTNRTRKCRLQASHADAESAFLNSSADAEGAVAGGAAAVAGGAAAVAAPAPPFSMGLSEGRAGMEKDVRWLPIDARGDVITTSLS
jgi:hypothetical protein